MKNELNLVGLFCIVALLSLAVSLTLVGVYNLATEKPETNIKNYYVINGIRESITEEGSSGYSVDYLKNGKLEVEILPNLESAISFIKRLESFEGTEWGSE